MDSHQICDRSCVSL